MAENELKWYEVVSIFFGIILGFADPITDILTLVEFYREDHKTWFGVGHSFIILPLLFFSIINVLQTYNGQNIWLHSTFSRFNETESAFWLPEREVTKPLTKQ